MMYEAVNCQLCAIKLNPAIVKFKLACSLAHIGVSTFSNTQSSEHSLTIHGLHDHLIDLSARDPLKAPGKSVRAVPAHHACIARCGMRHCTCAEFSLFVFL